jgi:hypothetical protein
VTINDDDDDDNNNNNNTGHKIGPNYKNYNFST